MKNLILSAFVVFGPLLGAALMFLPTVRRELRNLNK
jgi:hypothetical protein